MRNVIIDCDPGHDDALAILLATKHMTIRGMTTVGGNSDIENVTTNALKLYVDPEAAHIVFTSGISIKMCGLNLTRQANATDAEINRIRGLGNRVGQIAADLIAFYKGTLANTDGLSGAALHDPFAVATLIDPTLIEFETMVHSSNLLLFSAMAGSCTTPS